MKTFLVQLNHVVGSRSFCQILLVEAENIVDAVTMVDRHLEESIREGTVQDEESPAIWMDSDYYIEIGSLNEVNTFDELKNSMFTLR